MKPKGPNQKILDSIDYLNHAASMTELTGLMPTPPQNKYEQESYEKIFFPGNKPLTSEKEAD